MRAWTRWQDGVTLVVGVVLVIAAFVFADLWSPEMNTVLVLGAVLTVASLIALARPQWMADRWIVGAVGLLLVIAPWAVGYADVTGLAWFSWIGGAITVIMEAIALPQVRGTRGPQPHA